MQDTSLGASGRSFPTTRWAGVLAARDGRERTLHLGRLMEEYWKPVYVYIRIAWKLSNEEAKDRTQEFFTRFLEKDLLEQVDPDRGRFRTYLKVCLERFLVDRYRHEKAAKRGGGRLVSLDPADLPEVSFEEDPAGAFDRQWVRELVEGALAELEEILERAGRSLTFAIFRRLDVEPPVGKRPGYAELAEHFEVSRQTVKSQIEYARNAFSKLLLARIRRYSTDLRQAQLEMNDLFPL